MSITASQTVDRRLGDKYQFPVAASTLIYAGALVALNASNQLVNATDAAARRVIGVAYGEVDNSAGVAGELSADVEVGIFKITNSSTGTLTDSNIGQLCFVETNSIVSSAPGTNGVVAGVVRKVDSDGVWVDFGANVRSAGLILATGTHSWAGGAATTDSIPVAGLLSTDVVLCTLTARAATETLVLAVNDHANDQIDLTLSANGTNNTTRVAFLVIRPTL
jgi:hypothetical protein